MSFSSLPSGIKDANAVIFAKPGWLWGITVRTDGTNAATATVYNNASAASGVEAGECAIPGEDLTGYEALPRVWCGNGLYLKLAGTGAKAIVYYEPGPNA